MADDARPIDAEDDELEIEFVDVADLSEEEWDDDLRAAVAEAEADFKAGRLVPHEKVMEWLARVGTPDETPMPREWREV